MKKYTLLIIVVILLSLVFFAVGHEAFGGTSPGTLIQLQASHVPDKTDFGGFLLF